MSQLSAAYAQALYDLGREEHCEKQLMRDLRILQEAFLQEPDFLKLLCAPNISKEERCGVLDKSFRSRVHVYVLNFLKVLTEKGYIGHFSDCYRDYVTQYNADNGILPVRAVTAVPLTDSQSRKLTEKLSKITGKTVELTNRVDPECLGGVRLDYDGKCIDGTVQNRLNAIGNLLKNTEV